MPSAAGDHVAIADAAIVDIGSAADFDIEAALGDGGEAAAFDDVRGGDDLDRKSVV